MPYAKAVLSALSALSHSSLTLLPFWGKLLLSPYEEQGFSRFKKKGGAPCSNMHLLEVSFGKIHNFPIIFPQIIQHTYQLVMMCCVCVCVLNKQRGQSSWQYTKETMEDNLDSSNKRISNKKIVPLSLLCFHIWFTFKPVSLRISSERIKTSHHYNVLPTMIIQFQSKMHKALKEYRPNYALMYCSKCLFI